MTPVKKRPALRQQCSKTARSRSDLSRPIRLAVDAGIINSESTVFDFGCGRGDDLRILKAKGISCSGWDPAYRPDAIHSASDIVNLGYVINVIEDPNKRREALRSAWALSQKAIVISARLDLEMRGMQLEPEADGHVTGCGTFQKFYTQADLCSWVDETLDVRCVPAAPGIVLVFRDAQLREQYLASRYRHRRAILKPRISDVLYERHKDLLDPLMTFMIAHGRIPISDELADTKEIEEIFGSVKRAFAVVRHVTGSEQWDEIAKQRSDDLLVYIALTKFNRRPRFTDLSLELQRDVKAFFGAFTKACAVADELLFSAGDSASVTREAAMASVGKHTPEALYIHAEAVGLLPPMLRIYEGCARNYVGQVDNANIIKLHLAKPQVSYLYYPAFDKDPHPVLEGVFKVRLGSLEVIYDDYSKRDNPPILHRKELFVPEDYPGREKFGRLTRQEEKYGLFENTRIIGTRAGWEAVIDAKGLQLRGHRVIKKRTKATDY